MNELGTVALAREMASLGPGEALAGWRLTGVISLAVLASLFGYEAYATGRGSEWTNPLVRLWAGLALAFAVFMGHQYFWWFAEHLSAVGNCLHHDPAITFVVARTHDDRVCRLGIGNRCRLRCDHQTGGRDGNSQQQSR